MPTISDTITTADGSCPVTLAVPDGDGPWPAVVMYPDAGGVRPAMREMAARLAGLGYVVLLPDVYYRNTGWAPFDMKTAFGDEGERNRIFGLMRSVTPDVMTADARAFFDYLQGRPEVRGQRFGTTGYCMGGRTSLIVAGRVPDRVTAAMSFHGGGLAAEADPGSPHHLADRIRAAVYVGGAENDASYTEEDAERLDAALTAAGVDHVMEWYPGAHGFAVTDNAPFDEACAEKHWQAMREFFAAHLS